MIEKWIDHLTAVWAIRSNIFPGGTVLSYNVVTNSDFPESIDPSALAQQPIALTFPPSLSPTYSRGGPRTAVWSGTTEFHLAPDFSRARIGSLLPWYKLIWNALAGNPMLDNTVELAWIPEEPEAISALTSLQYGDEAKHWGLVVNWNVKEHVETEITVGGPP